MTTENFIRERKYLKAVTDKTVAWYRDSFKAFENALESETDIKARIIELRERGIKPVSVNTWLRAVKAYYLWQGKSWNIGRLREERKVLATFSAEHVQRLIRWTPATESEKRLKLLVLTALDTGLRIEEILGLQKELIDFDNLVIRVTGKGNKQRLVPMSLELRKLLFRHVSQLQHGYVFCTRDSAKLGQRNVLRDFKRACKKLGITGVRCSPHTIRHSFATHYLRKGGNLFYLSKILGHSSVKTTERYLQSLGIEDLKEVHSRLSLLSR